jgi:2,3-bisphosphoglycerate-independent phosphoglycerate mutase
MISLPFFIFKKKFSIKPVVLVVLDGFGIAPPSSGNAIGLANKPNLDRYFRIFPSSRLIASGEEVGLPANEVGNTEVGHLTLGAGRTILQDLRRINKDIEKGNFFDNKALVAASSHVKSNNSSFHILGLAGSGNVHSSLEHLFAILQFCKKEQISRVFLHIFTDGRDSPPNDGIEVIQKIQARLDLLRVGKIASVMGRFYAMDRDRRWERTEKAYKAIVLGEGRTSANALEALRDSYSKGQTDEFIEPTVIVDANGPIGKVSDGDAVFFFNYRIDRARQLSMAFTIPDFENLKYFTFDNVSNKKEKMSKTFERVYVPKNLFFVTMTEYLKGLPVSAIAFGPEVVEKPIGMCLSDAGYAQLRMAESEKERFVTYYFDGLREERFPKEEVKIIPSPKVETYDLKPEMSAPRLTTELIREIRRDKFHFALVNYANADMVGHTGNIKSTIKAIEVLDYELDRLIRAVLEQDGTIFLTADHGNAEELVSFPMATYYITSQSGTVSTDHTNNPVPFLVINRQFEGKDVKVNNGSLADVAPTIMKFMGLPVPDVMTGKNLLFYTSG